MVHPLSPVSINGTSYHNRKVSLKIIKYPIIYIQREKHLEKMKNNYEFDMTLQIGDGLNMAKLQKLRSSRSEEKLPSSHGSRGKGNRSMTDYEYNSFDEMDSKDDDNDVLFARKIVVEKVEKQKNRIDIVYSYFCYTSPLIYSRIQ